MTCEHKCSGNCRRNGCNCKCGEYHCDTCNGTGIVEILGDGENFECDVIGYKKCLVCNT